ncbi:nitric oxide reductase activation protein NorD [Oceanobacillus sp. CFH 90083]|uniref:vWA domain-containing protein n=1 Tax=Oceanobacillus sp. CFH 90083 TaxID=2592336 RepID=UPI00128C5732|nr:VWA domain-containing protein [Oceanobacillus sp. CFH 90083]
MYRFHQTKVDTHLFMQLQDLTAVLAKNEQLQFESSFGSFIDLVENKVTASRFWDRLPLETKEAGAKSDVILRTLGTLHQTDVKSLRQFKENVQDSLLPKFSIQLMTLLEDIRLEDAIRKERPGTKRNFTYRQKYFHHFFTTQLQSNITRSYATDEMFCMIYLLLFASRPDPGFPRVEEAQLDMLDSLKPNLYSVFETRHTRDNVALTEQIVQKMQRAGYTDSIHEYFILPIGHVEAYEKSTLFDELTRTDPLVNNDRQEETNEENEYFDETFSTWHRENKNDERKQNFLQFELEQGTKTSMLGGGARETEDGDQAMAAIQGATGQSEQNDYSDQESLNKEENTSENGSESSFGKENEHARMFTEYAETPTEDEELQYQQFVEEIDPFKRKLAKTIQLTLEHKQNTPRTGLLFGRLSKKLLPVFLDDSPRAFYKKEQESKEFDAVFTLLIDCSASMENKIEETKRGVTLFHEVLKELRIPHEIIGFWEDANKVSDNYQPNYLQYIQTLEDSFYKDQGAKIMQLEAQEDNRDGFSIRHVTQKLMSRSEKNKFLLVFSDGQPAASGYDQNGIVDTYQAVANARKHQIDVVGMFLANGHVEENDDTMMQNIYGKERIMVPDVSTLPEQFTPLLKRLLLKAI